MFSNEIFVIGFTLQTLVTPNSIYTIGLCYRTPINICFYELPATVSDARTDCYPLICQPAIYTGYASSCLPNICNFAVQLIARPSMIFYLSKLWMASHFFRDSCISLSLVIKCREAGYIKFNITLYSPMCSCPSLLASFWRRGRDRVRTQGGTWASILFAPLVNVVFLYIADAKC